MPSLAHSLLFVLLALWVGASLALIFALKIVDDWLMARARVRRRLAGVAQLDRIFPPSPSFPLHPAHPRESGDPGSTQPQAQPQAEKVRA